MTYLKPFILTFMLSSFTAVISAEESELSLHKKKMDARQNPTTGVTYEAVNPNKLPEREERWSDFLPIWGKEARENGYVLPHPFGLSIIGMHQDQPFDIHNIDMKIAGISFDGISASNVSVRDSTMNLRADAWIFPFLNTYLLAGKTQATSTFDLDINKVINNKIACRALNIPIKNGSCSLQMSTPMTLDIEGNNIGAGMTIAGGYGDFFGMIDINYTESDLDISKIKAKTTVTSARLGWNGKIGSIGGSLWIGAMHQDIKQTLDIILPFDALSVVIEQEASSPVNYLLGSRFNITQEWEVIIETNAGFADRAQFMMQLSYRM